MCSQDCTIATGQAHISNISCFVFFVGLFANIVCVKRLKGIYCKHTYTNNLHMKSQVLISHHNAKAATWDSRDWFKESPSFTAQVVIDHRSAHTNAASPKVWPSCFSQTPGSLSQDFNRGSLMTQLNIQKNVQRNMSYPDLLLRMSSS